MDPNNPVILVQTAAAAATVKRGGNYTPAEDTAITRAYIHISTDPITGSDQKEGTYYTRIWESYKTKKPTDTVTRPMTSVQTRVKTILKDRVRFAACYKSIKNLHRSGHSEEDEVRLATALFNNVKVTHPREDIGRSFRFLPCWELLRDLPKFTAMAQGNASSIETKTSEQDANSDTKTEVKTEEKIRPDGRRKAKEELAAHHMRAKKIKIAETAVKLQQQQVAEITRRNEILLFTNGPGGSESCMAKEFFALKQAEALEAIKARMQKKEAEKATNLNLLGEVTVNLDE